MSFLVDTEKAVKTIVAFLAADTSSSSTTSEDVSDLFAPVNESKSVSIDVQIGFLTAPSAHRVPLYYVVPHDTTNGSLCLITPAPQRKYKDKVEALCDAGDDVAKRVRRVIDSGKFAAKVMGPVAVRAFAKSYDHFIVYGVHKYPHQLTGEFLEHRRIPAWVRSEGNFTTRLHEAARTVVVPRRGDNAVTSRVAHSGLSVEEIIENVFAFVEKFVKDKDATPLENILHIRLCATSAKNRQIGLPIYGHVFDVKPVAVAPEEPAAKQAKVEA